MTMTIIIVVVVIVIVIVNNTDNDKIMIMIIVITEIYSKKGLGSLAHVTIMFNLNFSISIISMLT